MIWTYLHAHRSSFSTIYSCHYTFSFYMIGPVLYQPVQCFGIFWRGICMIRFCIVHHKVSCGHILTVKNMQDRSGIGWSWMIWPGVTAGCWPFRGRQFVHNQDPRPPQQKQNFFQKSWVPSPFSAHDSIFSMYDII